MKSMKLVAMLTVGVALIALPTTFGQEQETREAPKGTRLDVLRTLAGDWVSVGEDGKPGEGVISSFRVTAAGSAVIETLFPGTEHEMVTVYHLDGDDLLLTHYCAMGNQPRMRAKKDTAADRFEFVCVGGTNMKSESDPHMHDATISIIDADHFKARWRQFKDGEPGHVADFDLVRKKK